MKNRQFYLNEYQKTAGIFSMDSATEPMLQYAERQLAKCLAAANIADSDPDKAFKIYIGVEAA